MGIISTGKTDIGLVRKTNQDSIYLSENLNLFLVADGMGGHNGGDIASALAVDKVPTFVEEYKSDRNPHDFLSKAIQSANTAIFQKGLEDEKLKGMGTTAVAAYFAGEQLYLANVGDSRAYLFNRGNLYQLTVDHSLIQEKLTLAVMSGSINYDREAAKLDPKHNVITRTVGFEENVNVDTFEYQVSKNDLFLLCSDGLCGKVSDEQINRILTESLGDLKTLTEERMSGAVDELIEEAKRQGGNDNISVILLFAK